MALLTRPQSAAVTPQPAQTATVTSRTRGTPGRLLILNVVLAVVTALAGLAAAVGVVQRSSALDNVRNRSGVLTVAAQELYRSLSDADATAAQAFLSNGQEPAALRQRYQNDIAAASAALASATAGDGSQPAVRKITAQLPVYTGLVETARSYNRLNLPVGAGYLREASGLMRLDLLPAAQDLYKAETRKLDDDRSAAAGLPWLAIVLVLLSLATLAYGQVFLTRRTNRLFNVGLVSATAAVLVALIWLGVSWGISAADLDAARRDGSSQAQLLGQARIDLLQARADESLTLVARGNGADFEKDYTKIMATVAGKDGTGGLLGQARDAATDATVRSTVDSSIADLKKWRDVHTKLRGLDDGGNYTDAVTLAVGSGAGDSTALFTKLDGELNKAITSTGGTFDRHADGAAGALTAAWAGIGLLTLLALGGITIGFQRRLAEYR